MIVNLKNRGLRFNDLNVMLTQDSFKTVQSETLLGKPQKNKNKLFSYNKLHVSLENCASCTYAM